MILIEPVFFEKSVSLYEVLGDTCAVLLWEGNADNEDKVFNNDLQ